jgi:HAD superfamily hydrolase (TIGR01509 family)
MSSTPAPFADLDGILAHTRIVFLDFDGPVCSLFAGTPTEPVADRLRKLITVENIDLPTAIETTGDWFEILGFAYSVSPRLAARVADELGEIELSAALTALPTAYSHDVAAACRESARSLAVISNTSERAVRSYLDAHDLSRQIAVVSARIEADPSKLKPNPDLIDQAADALGSSPEACVMVGDSATDIEAAHSAGARAIGYAPARGDAERLASAGADALIGSMADLALRLRARPLPN